MARARATQMHAYCKIESNRIESNLTGCELTSIMAQHLVGAQRTMSVDTTSVVVTQPTFFEAVYPFCMVSDRESMGPVSVVRCVPVPPPHAVHAMRAALGSYAVDMMLAFDTTVDCAGELRIAGTVYPMSCASDMTVLRRCDTAAE